ncbi:MAG: DUF2207 domain-containing protein [Christensenellales bacterium]|jgi:uncharacterized membrane protein YgcG
MKKLIACLCLICIVLFALSAPAFAANRVERMEISVELLQDGSGWITQTWTGEFNEGTECYIPISDSGHLTLSDFSVTCDGELYATLDSWDTSASFDEKAYCCAIHNVSGGYELCWGISKYGARTYQISYMVHDLVRSYDESDGFNFMFVNRDLNTTPTDVSLYLFSNDFLITEENARAWAFGFEGEVAFSDDGGVQVWTVDPISPRNYVTVLFELQSGFLSPASRVSGSFEEVRERAFEGSDYSDPAGEGIPVAVLAVVGVAVIVIGVLAYTYSAKRKAALEAMYARHTDFVPVDLVATWRMGRLFHLIHEEGTIIGALLFRLVNSGCIVSTEPGVTGKAAAKVPLQMVHPPEDPSSAEALLYDLLLSACDQNGVLFPNYVKRCFKKNPEVMRDFLKAIETGADDLLMHMGCFTGRPSGSLKNLTEEGERTVVRVMRIQRVLTGVDPSSAQLYDSMNPADAWAYAILFGLKDEALRGIRAFYPDYVDDYYWDDMYAWYWYSYYYRDYSYGEMVRAERASGSGGSSSSGGGGGASGGGSGGGTR